jgi:FkbM family methyltransferase
MDDISPSDLPFGGFAPTLPRNMMIKAFRSAAPRGGLRKIGGRLLAASGSTLVDADLFGLPFRFDVSTANDRKALFSIRRFDVEERALIASHVAPAGVFLDIGAAIGVYSFSLALDKPGSRTYAFEPVPETFRRLAFNVANTGMQGRILPHRIALSDRTGSLPFDTRKATAASDSPDIDFPTDTLLGFVERENIPAIDAIKIDIEGFEDRVLFPFFEKASPALFPKLIIIEHGMNQGWARDCLALLRGKGYRETWRGSLNAAYVLY